MHMHLSLYIFLFLSLFCWLVNTNIMGFKTLMHVYVVIYMCFKRYPLKTHANMRYVLRSSLKTHASSFIFLCICLSLSLSFSLSFSLSLSLSLSLCLSLSLSPSLSLSLSLARSLSLQHRILSASVHAGRSRCEGPRIISGCTAVCRIGAFA